MNIAMYVTRKDQDGPMARSVVVELLRKYESSNAQNKDTVGGTVVSAETVVGNTARITWMGIEETKQEIIRVLQESGNSLCCLGFSTEIEQDEWRSIVEFLKHNVYHGPINYATVSEGLTKNGDDFVEDQNAFCYTLYFAEFACGVVKDEQIKAQPAIRPPI